MSLGATPVIQVDTDERPVTMLLAQSGQPNVRMVTVAALEVHRCVLTSDLRQF
jgi:hypothetical protein